MKASPYDSEMNSSHFEPYLAVNVIWKWENILSLHFTLLENTTTKEELKEGQKVNSSRN